MRKLTPIILLSAFLFNFSGYLVFFFVSKMEIREDMREIIREGGRELEKITLPLADYKKYLVEEHELFLNDKLYDVASVEIQGDSIIFYCIHDFAEQQLLASLDVFFEFEEENTNNNADTQLLNFLFISSIIHPTQSLIKNSIYLASIRDIAPSLQSQFISPNILPPREIISA